MSTTVGENAQSPNPINPDERLYGSAVCAIFLIFLTVIGALKFMSGQSPSWGWVLAGLVVIGAYQAWLL